MDKETIKSILLAHGFTIKPGCDDLREYVYKAAFELLELAAPAVQGEPVEFDYPDFHELGMGCGLEDRNITNRYEAMRYGWDKALDQVADIIDDLGPLYTAPQPAPDVSALVEIAREIVDLHAKRKVVLTVHVEALEDALTAYRKQGGEV